MQIWRGDVVTEKGALYAAMRRCRSFWPQTPRCPRVIRAWSWQGMTWSSDQLDANAMRWPTPTGADEAAKARAFWEKAHTEIRRLSPATDLLTNPQPDRLTGF